MSVLAERELDALLVTNLINVRYLTGFTGSSGLAVIGAQNGRPGRFITDFRYLTQSEAEVGDEFEREIGLDLVEQLADGWEGEEPTRLGFDDAHVSVKEHARLLELLPDSVELEPAGGVVEGLRAVKEEAELGYIRAAAELVDEIYAWILERGLVGRTERDVATELEHEMRRRGAAPSFESIVSAAAHSALPHGKPRDVEIPAGTLVTIDIGAQLDGYCSDCTRTFATGEPDDEQREVYDLVLEAQRAGVVAVAAGSTGRDVDAVPRAIIEDGGHGEHFGHGLGHGVGMEVHEGPRLSRKSADVHLAAGNVVTVEPGIYLPGRFGVRIEDLVVVTQDGREVLSGFPKELMTVS
jgi:Xaa-Pro aminopeptidase